MVEQVFAIDSSQVGDVYDERLCSLSSRLEYCSESA